MFKRNGFLAILAISFVAVTSLWANAANTTTQSASTQSATNTEFQTFDAGVAVLSGTGLPGISVTFAKNVTPSLPLYVGVDLGAFFTATDSRATSVPVMPTAFFLIDTHSIIQPIVGLSSGVVLNIPRGSGHTVEFGALFKPGLNARLSKTVHLEPRSSLRSFLDKLGVHAARGNDGAALAGGGYRFVPINR